MTRKSSWTGVLTSSDINEYLQDQAIQTYASTGARDTALTSPYNGQFAFTTDTGTAWVYNGSAWVEYGTNGAWKAWTPTFTNFTLGNGTLDCQYFKIGRTVTFKVLCVLGTTSAMGANPFFSLPFPGTDFTEFESMTGTYIDTSATARYAAWSAAGGSGLVMMYTYNAGSAIGIANIGATTPFTWASTDRFSFYGTYECTL